MPPSPPPDGASGTGPAPRYPVVRPPSPHPPPYVVSERSIGRHAAPADAGSTGASPRRTLMPAQTTTPGQTYGVRRTGLRHGGVYGTGVHRMDVPDLGVPDLGVPDLGVPDLGVPDLGVPRAPAGVRRSGLYDTGVHRTGVYDSGVHRTDVYDTGVHQLPDDAVGPLYRLAPPREVGGGRRRLDARDRTDGRA